ncbi:MULTISPECIES: efflux RND transporter periplasmic adaptor subunit [Pseudomonas syringae group]|uniref:Secretion protein HlyD n=1 Tax=Pseudomonas syringae pv. primulae TaxID=251707 RepID=A0A0Q0D7G8_9PSED|nr:MULTISPECIES: efflux RND transporter periplasmic adaptor subunit [Pseudomonas syringae group]KPY35001.1 Secretion protein HlyD [Pseudomonas syringae pv. primulae]MDY0934554.1 efflux RND transporter periplasmic adaptor subunit [Pseudomonas viridiflava]MDY1011193.1 efflux RND transporter periplasmic adaptor subunit [Pseudomonas viridiflava]
MRFHFMTLPGLMKRLGVGCGAVLLAVLVSGCDDKPAAVAPVIRAVKVETVRSGAGEGVRFSGVVRQPDSASLAFESAGTLAELRVDIGDAFEKGQVLAALDRQPAALRLQQAQASLSAATAQAAERGLNYQRQKNLLAAGSVAESVVEAARAAQTQAVADQVRAKSELALARREAERSQLIAPFSGRVVARRADRFAMLAAGQAVLQVESRNRPQVVAAVPVEQASDFKVGDRAHASRTSGSSAGFDLVLEGISPRSEDGLVRNCLFRLLDPAESVASGVTLLVQMTPEQGVQPLSIPVQALWMGTSKGAAQVFVYQPPGTVAIRNITLGAVRQGRAVVTEGLFANEQVVTAGTAFLQDGQTVSLFQPTTRLTESAP